MSTKKNRQFWMLEQLKENTDLTYTEMCAKYVNKYGKSNRTFDKDWKSVNILFDEYRHKIQAQKDEVRKKIELDFVKNGLKTKYERILILQNQVDDVLKELELGVFREVKREDDKAVTWERTLTPYEKAMLRRTIRQLQAEISKIEGDYADAKVVHSNDPENPLEVTSQIVIFQLPDNGRK